MLMYEDAAKTPSVGNFYFSPVRLRPVFEPAYLAEETQSKSRLKPHPKLDLLLDVKPKSRHSSVKGKTDEDIDVSNSDNLTENNSRYAKIDEENADSESESTTPKEAKKHPHKEKKSRNGKSSDSNKSTLEHLCAKLRVSFVLAGLGVIILIACCCALFLRNRIVACCKRCCWPFRKKKKKSKKDLFDVEEGDNYYQSSRKSSSRKSKKNKGTSKMVDTGTQDSRTSMAKAQEEVSKPVGCSPCCKKKKKKSGKKGKK